MGSSKNRPPKRNPTIKIGNRVLPGQQVELLQPTGVTFLNNFTGSVNIVAGDNISIVNDAGTIAISSSASGSGGGASSPWQESAGTVSLVDSNNVVSIGTSSPPSGQILYLTSSIHSHGLLMRLQGEPIGISQGILGGVNTMEFTTGDGSGNQATRLMLRGASADADCEWYVGVSGSEALTMILAHPEGMLAVGGNDVPFLGLEDFGTSGRPYSSPSVGVVTGSVSTASGSWAYFHGDDAGLFTYSDSSPAIVFNDSSKFRVGWSDHTFGDVDGVYTKFLEIVPVTKAGSAASRTSGSLVVGQNASGSSQFESTLQVNGSIVLGDLGSGSWGNTIPNQPFTDFRGERLMILDNAGIYVIATQDGTGRVNETWNAVRIDNAYYYVTSGEVGFRRTLSTAGRYEWNTATTGSAAGDPVSWNRHLAIIGGTDASPRVEIDQYYTAAEQPRMCVIRNTNSSSTAQFIVFAAATVSSNITTENITLNSPAAGRYTVGKTGTYFLNCTLYLISSGIDTACRLSVFLNGVESHFVIAAIHSSVDPVERTLSVMMDLTAGDIVDIRADSGGGLTTTAQAGCVLNMWMVA